MTAIRSVRAAEGKFVILSNDAGQDQRLSWQARGIIYYVLSLPPDRHLTAAWLEQQAPNGRESLRSALAELEKYGYYRRTKISAGHGKWEWEQTLSDSPMPALSYDGNPSHETTCGNCGSPQVTTYDGNPSDENPSDKELKTEPQRRKTRARASGVRAPGAASGEVLANTPLRNARGAA